jgi:primosomal protein N' (replication factor Y)
MMEYPPFCDICLVGFSGPFQEKTQQVALRMLDIIKELIQTRYPDLPIKILGPAPAQIAKVGGKYRVRMIIKCKNNKQFRGMLSAALIQFGQQKGLGGVTAYADMNPEGFL